MFPQADQAPSTEPGTQEDLDEAPADADFENDAGGGTAGDLDLPSDSLMEHTDFPHPDAPSPSLGFIRKFKEINDAYNEEKWKLFEEELEKYIVFGQGHVGLDKFKENRSKTSNSQINPRDPAAIQRLYRRNPRRSIRTIRNDTSAQCEVNHDELRRHFSSANK